MVWTWSCYTEDYVVHFISSSTACYCICSWFSRGFIFATLCICKIVYCSVALIIVNNCILSFILRYAIKIKKVFTYPLFGIIWYKVGRYCCKKCFYRNILFLFILVYYIVLILNKSRCKESMLFLFSYAKLFQKNWVCKYYFC